MDVRSLDQEAKPVGIPEEEAILKQLEVRRIISHYLRTSREDIQAILKNHAGRSSFEINICAALEKGISNGDLTNINKLLDRVIGKVKEEVDVTMVNEDEELNRERIRAMSMPELICLIRKYLPEEENELLTIASAKDSGTKHSRNTKKSDS
jgi:hypothetical protein